MKGSQLQLIRPGERRGAPRNYPFAEVYWRRHGGHRTHRGILASYSISGASVLIPTHYPVKTGQTLLPSAPDANWSRPLNVNRVDSISERLNLASGRFVDQLPPAGLQYTPDRRRSSREGCDRRQSPRWRTNKSLAWRLHRGRRKRHGRVVERSLHGLVFESNLGDTPRRGNRIRPADSETGDRLGFRSAIVQRTRPTSLGRVLVYAEIES